MKSSDRGLIFLSELFNIRYKRHRSLDRSQRKSDNSDFLFAPLGISGCQLLLNEL